MSFIIKYIGFAPESIPVWSMQVGNSQNLEHIPNRLRAYLVLLLKHAVILVSDIIALILLYLLPAFSNLHHLLYLTNITAIVAFIDYCCDDLLRYEKSRTIPAKKEYYDVP